MVGDKAPSARAFWLNHVILMIIGLGLVWQGVSKTLATYLLPSEPEWALAPVSANFTAKLQLAGLMLGQDMAAGTSSAKAIARPGSSEFNGRADATGASGVPSPMLLPEISAADRATVGRLAGDAGLEQPRDARASRLMGQLADDDDAACNLMARSWRLSMQEPRAHGDRRFQYGGGLRIATGAAPARGGDMALRPEFPEQSITVLEAGQMMVPAPGTCMFSGPVSGLVGTRCGLHWQMACMERPAAPCADRPLAYRSAARWRDVACSFTLPSAGCAAQHVSLELGAISKSGRMVSGIDIFTHLAIHVRR